MRPDLRKGSQIGIKNLFYIGPIGLLATLFLIAIIFFYVKSTYQQVWQEVTAHYFSVLQTSNETSQKLDDLNKTLLLTLLSGNITLSEGEVYDQGIQIIDKLEATSLKLHELLAQSNALFESEHEQALKTLTAELQRVYSNYEIAVRSAVEMATVNPSRISDYAYNVTQSQLDVFKILNEVRILLAQQTQSSSAYKLQQFEDFLAYIWLLLLGVTFLLFGINFYISKRASNAIDRVHHSLVDTVNNVTKASSDLKASDTVSVSTLESVVETFNKIVLELNQQKQATEMAQQRAESASQAKTEFLSSMSHEFRTPLNAVMGFAELLASDTETPLNEEQIEFLQYIIENGEYLLLLIDDVLHLIQIDDPALATEREPVDVISIIEEVCNRIRPLAEQHALVIHNHTASMETKYVLADREKLWQVLLNIALNAVNYNVEKGAIQFTCENITEHTIRLSIIDSGIGVDDEDLSKLFEPFNRLHNENTAVLGAGIGLTVCQKLITLMKGQIGVKKNHDRGLTFWIDLESADNSEV